MRGLGFVEIDYYIVFPESEPVLVRGVQVGRFAIRHADPDDHGVGKAPSLEDAPWRIDHIPSGLAVAAFDNFDDAYALADDLSRFSKSDPSSKDQKRIRAQMGESVTAWMRDITEPFRRGASSWHIYIPYRKWLAEQGKEWKPRRRKMKSLFG